MSETAKQSGGEQQAQSAPAAFAESISIDQLPYTQDGAVLGRFLVQLRDEFNSHHAGVAWEGGRSMEPIPGRLLRRLVGASNNVIGILRVEGEPFEFGDVQKLRELAPDAPRAAPALEPVVPAAAAPLPQLSKPVLETEETLEKPSAAASELPAADVLPTPPEPPTKSKRK